MASFDDAFSYLMRFEDSSPSGKVTKDAGGLTKYGISQKAYPLVDIESLTIDGAKQLYHLDYWRFDPIRDQVLANKVFQIVVNLGMSGGTKLIQTCLVSLLGTPIQKVDGVMGDWTVMNIDYANKLNLLVALDAAQLAHYVHAYGGDIKNVPGGLIVRARS